MRDAPPVTVSDPGGGGRSRQDVLVGGAQSEPRLSRRSRVLAGATLVLLAAGAVAGTAYAQHRAEQRAHAAAFAAADEVHVESELVGVFGFEPGSGRLGAEVALTSRAGRPGPHTVPSVRLEGPGLLPLAPGGPGRFTSTAQGLPESRVDCATVAAGGFPGSAEVVVTVVPASQVPHEQRLPVPPDALREAVLSACDLPDPDAEPYAETAAVGPAVLVFVEAVPRSDALLRLEDVRVPGFSLRPGDRGFALPYLIQPDSGGTYGFDVRVVDCQTARAGDLAVTVVLSQDNRREERVVPHAVRQPQPGAVPVEQLLQRLLDESC